jgi:hypothetical protein|tara:strand:- start:281 stop:421 length:141 start_codon:yes stop_codon:yes gene_type:complete
MTGNKLISKAYVKYLKNNIWITKDVFIKYIWNNKEEQWKYKQRKSK